MSVLGEEHVERSTKIPFHLLATKKGQNGAIPVPQKLKQNRIMIIFDSDKSLAKSGLSLGQIGLVVNISSRFAILKLRRHLLRML